MDNAISSNATTNALADAEHAATQARVSAIVSSPWGHVRVGDPDRANLFVGSRQVVSEADLFNGCLTNHRSTNSAVPDDVRARIAVRPRSGSLPGSSSAPRLPRDPQPHAT